MFTNPVREKTESHVELADIGAKTLSIVLQYIYSGEITVNESNAQSLYMVANQLELLPLIKTCSTYLIQEITVENCIEFHNFGTYFSDECLQTESLKFIELNFVEVSKQSSFLKNMQKDLLKKLLISNNLNVECEETVFVAMLSWIQDDLINRCQHLKEFFTLIRIPLLSDKFLREKVFTHPLIANELGCINHIKSYFSFISESGKAEPENIDRGFLSNLKLYSTLRVGMKMKKMLVFSGGSNSPETRSFSCYDPINCKNYLGISSHPSFDFKYRIDYFKLVTVNMQYVYFLGGILYENHHFEEQGEAFRRVYLHDPVTMKWTKKASMLYPRCAFAACVQGTDIYALGGKSTFPRGDPLDSMEVYDSVHDNWLELLSMPCHLFHHTASICCESIYVFGGTDIMGSYSDNVLQYSIVHKDWTKVKTNLLKPRSELSSVVIQDKIYIVGGSHKHANALSLEIYSPARTTWQYGSEFPDERKITCVAGHENKIYVYGGCRLFGRQGRALRTVECKDLHSYNPATDTWEKEVKSVQYGNSSGCTVAKVNTSYLHESDFISQQPDT